MTSFFHVLKDVQEAFLQKKHVWMTISFMEVKTKYKRTVLGPFWLSLGTGIVVLGMGFIWSSLFHLNLKTFLPYVATGIIFWTFISSVLTDSCWVFIIHSEVIHNTKVPLLVHILTMISKNVIIMLHNMLVIMLVFLICRQNISLESILFIPGLILLILNAIWISLFFAIIATRYRDITPIIAYSMTLVMMATPVLWKEDMLSGNRKLLASLNPLTHFLRIVRDPLLGHVPSFTSYGVTFSFLVFGTGLALLIYKKYMHRIVYWL